MKLQIDSIDLSQNAMKPLVDELAKTIQRSKELATKRETLPRYLTKQQAATYLNCSYNTLTGKYIPNGLRVIIVDGMTRLDKVDCDSFMESFKK